MTDRASNQLADDLERLAEDLEDAIDAHRVANADWLRDDGRRSVTIVEYQLNKNDLGEEPRLLREAVKQLRAMPTIAGDDAELVKRLRCRDESWDCTCEAGGGKMHRVSPNPCKKHYPRPYPFLLLHEAADRIEALTATPRPKFDPLAPMELSEEAAAELDAISAKPSPLEGVTLQRVPTVSATPRPASQCHPLGTPEE